MGKIGKQLKDKREAQRLTMEDVNSSTRIPLKFITYMENDEVGEFPAEVYYLGSLRRYAQFLGLDDNALVSAYKEEKNICQKAPCPPQKTNLKMPAPAFWKALAAYMAAVALLAAAWLSLELRGISKSVAVPRQRPPKIEKSAPAKAQPKDVKSKSALPAALQQKQTQASAPVVKKALRLEIEALDSSWIKVTADGKVEYTAILEKGLKKEWSADSKFGLVVGYAPGVRVRLNGKEINVTKNAKQDISDQTLTAEDAR